MTTELATRLQASTRKSPYFAKDLRKAAAATQFIGDGSRTSSTKAYATAAGDLANTGHYAANDTIFVSAEGARAGRVDPIGINGPRGVYRNIDLAIAAGARFVIDTPTHRERPYNVGERQVAAYLVARGYGEVASGLFAAPL